MVVLDISITDSIFRSALFPPLEDGVGEVAR